MTALRTAAEILEEVLEAGAVRNETMRQMAQRLESWQRETFERVREACAKIFDDKDSQAVACDRATEAIRSLKWEDVWSK